MFELSVSVIVIKIEKENFQINEFKRGLTSDQDETCHRYSHAEKHFAVVFVDAQAQSVSFFETVHDRERNLNPPLDTLVKPYSEQWTKPGENALKKMKTILFAREVRATVFLECEGIISIDHNKSAKQLQKRNIQHF